MNGIFLFNGNTGPIFPLIFNHFRSRNVKINMLAEFVRRRVTYFKFLGEASSHNVTEKQKITPFKFLISKPPSLYIKRLNVCNSTIGFLYQKIKCVQFYNWFRLQIFDLRARIYGSWIWKFMLAGNRRKEKKGKFIIDQRHIKKNVFFFFFTKEINWTYYRNLFF